MQIENMVPEVYYKESRDFAFIGRLIEIAFNYMKTGADCVINNFTNVNTDNDTLELLCDSLGFEVKHNYITKDLLYIISNFSQLLKKKGTIEAVELAVKTLISSQGIDEGISESFIEVDRIKNEFTIMLPEKLTDTILLEDLFDYILPVGTTYKFEKISNSNAKYDSFIPIIEKDTDTVTESSDKKELRSIYKEDYKTINRNYGTINATVVYSDYNKATDTE